MTDEKPTPVVVKDNFNPCSNESSKQDVYMHCQWYQTEDTHRNTEINYCLEQNLRNKNIDHFIWYVPSEYLEQIPQQLRGEVVPIRDRLTFGTAIRRARDREGLHILINTDIVVPESAVSQLKERIQQRDIVCLSRWESSMQDYPKARLIQTRGGSQDLWAWRSTLAIHDSALDVFDRIPLGVPGCDNRMAYEFGKLGNTINPSNTIRTYHIHESQYRTYTIRRTEPVPRYYATVAPSV